MGSCDTQLTTVCLGWVGRIVISVYPHQKIRKGSKYMIKKTILAVALLAGSGMAFAGNDNGSGCGAGSTIFKGQSGLAPHVMAATTNGTLGNQTFGMTSGTSGCNVNQPITVAAADFIDHNMEKVARGMATGSGESIDTLANLMGISSQDNVQFKAVMHAQFATIFSYDRIHSNDVISNLNEVMKQDVVLAKYAG